jgi:hypothetical protein
MNVYEQEGTILNLLNDYKNKNDYKEFQKMGYFEVIKYIKTRELKIKLSCFLKFFIIKFKYYVKTKNNFQFD